MPSTVQVFCRFRPANQRELESETHFDELDDSDDEYAREDNFEAMEKMDDNNVQLRSVTGKKKGFSYNHVFVPEDSQMLVYRKTVRHLIPGLLQGINASVLAYGQSGSGKTYTMFGPTFEQLRSQQIDLESTAINKGLVPRAVDELFYQIEMYTNQHPSSEFNVSVSFVQIYNEKVTDLFVPEMGNLKIRQNKNGKWFVPASSVTVTSAKDVLYQIERGTESRVTKSTNLNDVSSRSHAILSINVEKSDYEDGSEYNGRIDFVDLAGSENASKSLATNDRLKEAGFINKSLMHLRAVIKYLGTRKKKNIGRRHLLYRNSSLTKLLYDSLGGNSNSLLMLCASPHMYNTTETLSTLCFGSAAQRIHNIPTINKLLSGKQLKKSCSTSLQKIETQKHIIRRKKKEIERNRRLAMEIIAQLDPYSDLYKQIMIRLPHVISMPPQVTKRWGKLLLPESLMMNIFTFAGCNTAAACLYVCSDWNKLLKSEDHQIQKFWKDIASAEKIVVEKDGEWLKAIVDFVMKDVRAKKEAALSNLGNKYTTGGLLLT